MTGRVFPSSGGLTPTHPFWIPAFAGMTRCVAGVYPGSWSGTCIHSDRSCRLAPGRQGRKIGRIGWWEGQVSSVPPTPPLAGDKPQRYILLPALRGVVNSRFGTAKMGGDVVEVDWGIHPESKSGTCPS